MIREDLRRTTGGDAESVSGRICGEGAAVSVSGSICDEGVAESVSRRTCDEGGGLR